MSQAQGVSIHDLQDELKGEVIVPEDPGYDEARQVFFKGFDRKPAAVARVAGADDVARVVTAAREDGLELAVRSGGHSRAGYGTSEGGIVIDLSAMKALDIDADAKTASVQTGITAGRVHDGDRRSRPGDRAGRRRVGRARRHHAGRRRRLPGPQERPDDR